MNNIEYKGATDTFQHFFANEPYNKNMYYEILVGSLRYHKRTPLTYSHDTVIEIGSIVEVTLQNTKVLGIVIKKVAKPAFNTKDINRVLAISAISKQSLKLIEWLKLYYPAPHGTINSLLIPNLLFGPDSNTTEFHGNNSPAVALPPLTDEQKSALAIVDKMTGHSALLHGDTGSGKTRIYIELAKKTLKSGRSAIILTPEIGLTTQLVNSFMDVFPDRIVLIHSRLTQKQRRTAWWNIIRSTKPIIVIGPRSALFVPLQSIGLIVVDEMHDNSYKQEQAPYYETTRVAAKLAEIHKAKAIFGSATPNIADYFVFKNNKLPIIRMTKNAVGKSSAVKTTIIDLRNRENFKTSAYLSTELIKSINQALRAKEQSLLFLNRRGTARVILCTLCGWQANCPKCDLPLTYHGDTHISICHTCGYSIKPPTQCPECTSENIIFRSAGTKSIVSELERLFPKAIIKRFDSDIAKKDKLESQLKSLQSGEIDILVGTQILGKGLDLPRLALVGVVLADTALNFPDYTAQERTYQMLNQVFGRVGRGHRLGRIVIQTYNPDSKVIIQAIEKNFIQFYTDQLLERRQFNFPPYCYILKLSCSRKTSSSAQKAATALTEQLKSKYTELEIIGPSPAFIEKLNDTYYWQILLKSKKRSMLTSVIHDLPANWMYDIDPSHLL